MTWRSKPHWELVRSLAMEMRRGNELADVSLLLFEQFSLLGIKSRSCGFLIMNEETKSMEDWSANLDEYGKGTLVIGSLAYDQHPLTAEVVATWQRRDPYFIGEIHGEALQEYYEADSRQFPDHQRLSLDYEDELMSALMSPR
ncbi:MAG: hypothetical protein IPL46_22220 [Saprospiraceae bacterium]|nr:hypothetical protein [Saprospiraceae bacterium]